VARSYEDVVAALRSAADPDLDRFTQAAEAHFEEAYRLTFGLGKAVATRRQELNLSQTQLAAATGIPQADISRIERGKGNPTRATIEKLLTALQLAREPTATASTASTRHPPVCDRTRGKERLPKILPLTDPDIPQPIRRVQD
jgi:transcriptional regulator with XRE-family HTH domain